jgi:probable DNA metabolism protein
MTVFLYDHTFEGLLTTLFDAYARKTFPEALLTTGEPLPLFCDEVHTVVTDPEKSERVWKALRKKLSAAGLASVTGCWLSELPEAPMLLMRYLRKVFDSPRNIETHYADPDVLAVWQLGRKVSGERMRVLQFMRFQKTADGTYFGIMEPLYNVLSLTVRHFRDRFADQPWIIYDARRRFGYYYDRTDVSEITFSDPAQQPLTDGILREDQLDEKEKLFQDLWKSYFKTVCIRERLNPVKHRKDMPVRYWKYLTEKR